jgi:Tol biopolymer transport system component
VGSEAIQGEKRQDLIALQRFSPEGSWDVWTVRPDGSGARNLTPGSPGIDVFGVISPAGKQIAYSAGGGFCFGSPYRYLVVMNLDGSDKTCMATGARANYPAWAPNGKSFVFTSGADGQLYSTRADGTGTPVALTSGDSFNWGARFSPDGRHIVFVSDHFDDFSCPGGAAGYSCGALYTMHADGTHVRKLVDAVMDPCDPDWSPDGETIAFANNFSAPNSRLFLVDSDGEHLRAVTAGATVNDYGPRFSPDGSRVAFTHCDDPVCNGPMNVFTVRLNGRDRQQVTWGDNDEVTDWGPRPRE